MIKFIGFLFFSLFLAVLSTCGGGEGLETYEVSNVSYAFSAENPAALDLIAFDLDKPAETVTIGLSDEYYLCESAEPFTHWTCPLGGAIFVSGMMRVIATP